MSRILTDTRQLGGNLALLGLSLLAGSLRRKR